MFSNVLSPKRVIIVFVLILGLVTQLHAVERPTVVAPFNKHSSIKQEFLFTIHGSNTIGASLAPNLVADYLKAKGAVNVKNHATKVDNEKIIQATIPGSLEQVKVKIAAHGSSTGFKGLLDGSADIAASSRPIKDKEVKKLSHLGDMRSNSSEHIVGIDGLAIIVHPSNPLNQLTKQTIARLFSGEISNWKALGGQDQPVSLYARDNNSGTWDTFKNLVLGKKHTLSTSARRFESNDQLSETVSNNPGAIGFTGVASTNNSKVLAVSDGESRALMPVQLSIATEDYPLARRLYFYTSSKSSNNLVNEFIAYTGAYEGQEVVNDTGFVSQNIIASQPADDPTVPDTFKKLVNGYQRLSVNFRFSEGRTRLDNKAERDIDRLIAFIDQHELAPENVMLIGYSDRQSNELRAQLISEIRALSVKKALKKRGKVIKAYTGYGQYMPLATTDGNKGVFKNGRVEVWAQL